MSDANVIDVTPDAISPELVSIFYAVGEIRAYRASARHVDTIETTAKAMATKIAELKGEIAVHNSYRKLIGAMVGAVDPTANTQ
jgi:hypothetical protein